MVLYRVDDREWTAPGTFEVVPGIFRIPLPLPNDLVRAVNVYAIIDHDELVLIDGGYATPDSRTALERALADLGERLGDVRRFLITHIHRDHYSQAASIRKLLGTSLFVGAGERELLEKSVNGESFRWEHATAMLTRGGALSLIDDHDSMRAHFGAIQGPPEMWRLPDGWLFEGDVQLHSRSLDVVPTPGHTPGHVVFHDRKEGVLFAGDHVLPDLLPPIGFEPVASCMPLADHLNSLAVVRSRPDAQLLPAHGAVTPSAHARVDELLADHDERLTLTAEAVDMHADTALAVARLLPWTPSRLTLDQLDIFTQIAAVSEALAQLDVLVACGWLANSTDADGVVRFQRP